MNLMKPSLEKLQKFFKLEAERGYDNHAVLGGLDRMLDHWESQARADELPEGTIQAVSSRIRDYSRLSPASRAEVLDGVWKRVMESTSAPTAPPEPPKVEETAEPPESAEIAKPEPEPTPPAVESPSPAPEEKPADEAPVPKPSPAAAEPAALDAPVTVLSGIGERNARTLERLELNTLMDMLYHFPRRYDDYSQLKPINRLEYGETVTIIGTIQNVNTRKVSGGRRTIVEAVVSDGSGSIKISWFNQAWRAKSLRLDSQVVISGKIDQYLGRLVMSHPELELLDRKQLHTNRIVPVYPLTADVKQRWLRRQINQVATYWAPRVQDPLPEELRRSAELLDLGTALLQVHAPDSWDDLRAARERLAFDEIFLLQLGMMRQKNAWQERTARQFMADETWYTGQVSRLPFQLTAAQVRAISDIRTDLASGHPMNRLIQGDVGSGKTIVAALAVAIVTHHGPQAALMAPTSILAEQHYQNLMETLAGTMEHLPTNQPPALRPDQIRLMIGATPEAEKQEIRAGLESGHIKLVIGTHALIEDPVVFADLQLIIIDEQHRFGVNQRATLRSKGENPHLIVMTATPIPRSLALTVYGDLDLTVIDEMPPGRQPISTHVLKPVERERAYMLIRRQVELGHQGFIIYPLVEESESSDAKAAVEEHARLQNEVFPDLKIGLLHGRLRPDEKETVMSAFRDGGYHIVVSTSVVEVGVDIPNATIMVIEGANRFGLAQLHQFRGRVGRGADESLCLLIPDKQDEVENERLKVMSETNDGFILAERDLEQRGPGQFLGTRQSGYSEIQIANLTNVRLIEKARRHAQELFQNNPDLSGDEYQLLAGFLQRSWATSQADIS
jgi:ATP-dependent DNA helicase RecG